MKMELLIILKIKQMDFFTEKEKVEIQKSAQKEVEIVKDLEPGCYDIKTYIQREEKPNKDSEFIEIVIHISVQMIPIPKKGRFKIFKKQRFAKVATTTIPRVNDIDAYYYMEQMLEAKKQASDNIVVYLIHTH